MTENEAKREMTFDEIYEVLQKEKDELFAMEKDDCEPPFANCVVRRALRCIRKLLEELQSYRAIGTTPTRILELVGGLNIELSKYAEIGTIEEFKALKEKNEPKKVTNIQKSESPEDIEYMGEDTLYGYCPCCEEYSNNVWNAKNCGECGQALDWSE